MCTQQCEMRAAIILVCNTVCNRAVYIIHKFIYTLFYRASLLSVRKFSSLRMFRNWRGIGFGVAGAKIVQGERRREYQK